MEVENIEQSLNIELREYTGGAEDRVGRLRVVRRCLEWIARDIILRPGRGNKKLVRIS